VIKGEGVLRGEKKVDFRGAPAGAEKSRLRNGYCLWPRLVKGGNSGNTPRKNKKSTLRLKREKRVCPGKGKKYKISTLQEK